MQSEFNFYVQKTSWQANEDEIKSVRSEVFVKEQKVPADIDFDGLDNQCIHWLAYHENGLPLATGRLLPDGHFGRMAVLKPYRKCGVGETIMRAAIAAASEAKLAEIYLHAQITALPFYQGLGFVAYGEEFIDADMPHIAMRLPLTAD